jgi:hypothetical protein
MNSQEIYNNVKNHLIAQGRRSEDTDNTCMYRSADGAMCAAGCLIRDEFYDKRLEGKRVHDPGVMKMLANSGIDKLDLHLVAELQRLHDLEPVAMWSEGLKKVAVAFNLVP